MTDLKLRFAAVPAVALTLLAAPALAQGQASQGANQWDRDGDGIGPEEFLMNYDVDGTIFDSWDQDHDELLSREEFRAGMHNYYDGNRDDRIDQNEVELLDRDLNTGRMIMR